MFAAILVLAVLCRIALMSSGGNEWDLDIYKAWTRTIAAQGVVHAYDGKVTVDYPPVFLYWLDIGSRLYQTFISPDLTVNRPELTGLIRFPSVVFDLILITIIFQYVRKEAGDRWGLIASAAYALNPAVLFSLGYWGMPDTPHAVMIVAALILAMRKQPLLAWAIISIGVFTKPQAQIFAPMVAVITLREGGFRDCFKGAAGAVIGSFIATAPFLFAGTADGILTQMLSAAEYDPYISNNAHNLWWLAGWGYAWQIRDTESLFGPLSYRSTGIALFLAAYLFVLWRTWKAKTEAQTIELGAYLGLALFMLMTVIHETHSYTAFPLLALIWWRSRALGWLYAALSVVFFTNLALHDSGLFALIQDTGLHRHFIGFTMINTVAFCGIFFWWSLRIGGTTLTPRALSPITAGLVVLALVAFGFSPRVVDASFTPRAGATQSDAVFGDQIRLLEYTISPERATPGSTLHVRFAWQPTRDIHEHYMLFVHLVGTKLEDGGKEDGPPTRNLYPTRLWRAGDVIYDERSIVIPANAKPGVYNVEAGFYPLTDFKRMQVVAHGVSDNRLVLGRVTIPVGQATPVGITGPTVAFDSDIQLLGTRNLPSRPAPGSQQAFDLVFQSAGTPTIDYTVFVQMLASDGSVSSQADAQPQNGAYPTTAWRSGDVVLHPVALRMPNAGTYRVIAGLYDVKTGTRLKTGNADFVELGSVTVP